MSEPIKGPWSTCDHKPHRRRVFLGSLMDWLEDEPKAWRSPIDGYEQRRPFAANGMAQPVGGIPAAWLADALDIVRRADQLSYILCTKRPENFKPRMEAVLDYWREAPNVNAKRIEWLFNWPTKPPPNITILASVEDQQTADERIPHLLRIPAARRGLSIEPLLGPVDLELQHGCRSCNHPGNIIMAMNEHGRCSRCDGTGHEPSGIDWVIIGCESGPNRRNQEHYAEHAHSLIDQCHAAGVPVFHKQMPIGGKVSHNPAEWPDWARVQQWTEGV